MTDMIHQIIKSDERSKYVLVGYNNNKFDNIFLTDQITKQLNEDEVNRHNNNTTIYPQFVQN